MPRIKSATDEDRGALSWFEARNGIQPSGCGEADNQEEIQRGNKLR
jgi:hypothetical protein